MFLQPLAKRPLAALKYKQGRSLHSRRLPVPKICITTDATSSLRAVRTNRIRFCGRTVAPRAANELFQRDSVHGVDALTSTKESGEVRGDRGAHGARFLRNLC